MEALGVAGSVVGIISLGIQLSQIIQQQIDSVRGADERVKQIVAELQVTASSLGAVQELQLHDERSPTEKIFNETGSQAISQVVQRCNFVFRNIVILVAKAGKEALVNVDDFQRKINKRQTGPKPNAVKLEIELSNLEHLLWPWRLAKIEQYLADLERLKSSLLLLLAVAELARKIKKTINTRSVEAIALGESEGEAPLVDRLYYRDKIYQETRKYSVRVHSRPLHQSPTSRGLELTVPTAHQLIQNWPYLPDDGGKVSLSDLLQLGVILEGFTVDIEQTRWSSYTQVPLNLRAVWEEAIQAQKEPSKSVWNIYATLPARIQDIIRQALDDLRIRYKTDRDSFDPKYDDNLTLLSLKIHKNRRIRFVEKLKSFTCFYGPGQTRANVLVIVARTVKSNLDRSSSYQQDEGYPDLFNPLPPPGPSNPLYPINPHNPIHPLKQPSSRHYRQRSRWDDDGADGDDGFPESTYHRNSRSPLRRMAIPQHIANPDAPMVRYNSQINPNYQDYSPVRDESQSVQLGSIFRPTRPYIRPFGESRTVTFDTNHSGTRAHNYTSSNRHDRRTKPNLDFPDLHLPRSKLSYERIRDPMHDSTYDYGQKGRDQYEGYQDYATEMSSDEDLPPSEQKKIALARQYLRKWTTVGDNAEDTNPEEPWDQEESAETTHQGDIVEISPRRAPSYKYVHIPEGARQNQSRYADTVGPITTAGSRDMTMIAQAPRCNSLTFPQRPSHDHTRGDLNTETSSEEGNPGEDGPRG